MGTDPIPAGAGGELLRIGELSRRSGVTPDLLRAWERRYGLLAPRRTQGGFRLYTPQDERRLGAQLSDYSGRIDLMLTHLHLDHLQGLGFFEPCFRPDVELHIWGPASTTADLGERLARYLSPPLFPVRLRSLGGRVVLHDVPRDPFEIGDVVVQLGNWHGWTNPRAGSLMAFVMMGARFEDR